MTCRTVTASSIFQTDRCTRAHSKMLRKTGMAYTSSTTPRVTRVHGATTSSMGMVNTHGQMAVITSVNGRSTPFRGKAGSSITMAESTKGSSRKMQNMAKVPIVGRTARSIRASGKMANSADKANTPIPREK